MLNRSSNQTEGCGAIKIYNFPTDFEAKFVEINSVNDETPQGSFIKLNTNNSCNIYPNSIKNTIEKEIVLLVRPLFKEMIKLLKTRLGRCKRIITGPVDCGKSTCLYEIAQYCKLSGWIVFYLPDCTELMFDTNTPKANDTCKGILLNMLELNHSIFEKAKVTYSESTFKELIENGIKEEKCENCLLKLISKLCNCEDDQKVLFAFDCWNRLLENETAPNPIVETIAYWNSFRVSNGVAFFGTTGLFNPYSDEIKLENVFTGVSRETQTNFLSIKPFDKDETRLIWNYMKRTFPDKK